MKFMMSYSWTPDPQRRAEGLARFARSGGVPPHGIRLLGRWTAADLGSGFALVETEDPGRLAEFAYQWSDLMALDFAPVLDDAQLAAVLPRAAG